MSQTKTKPPTEAEREQEQALLRAKWNERTNSFVYGKEAMDLRKREQSDAKALQQTPEQVSDKATGHP